MSDLRPPIPASLAHRPTSGGLAIPWINVELRDGGADFRTARHARYEQSWSSCLCQSCGKPTGPRAVLVCGPRQLLSGKYDEPPVCPPCALYASNGCPMVAGRRLVYADRSRITESHRGQVCPDPECDCGGLVDSDPEHSAEFGGQPAHPWYACWVPAGRWQLTGHIAHTRCSDRGCVHERMVINGATLDGPPLKVVLVSEPGRGRIWRTLSWAEAREHATAARGGDDA